VVIIKVILGSGLLGILIYAVVQYRRSRLLSGAMIATSIAGIVFVMFPDITDVLANAVGIGRGVDLILYCFVLVALIAIFNLHLRMRASTEVTTELARAIALMSPREPGAAKTHLSESDDEALLAGSAQVASAAVMRSDSAKVEH